MCAGGYRKITPVFTSILNFLTLNPGEVVIVELQVGGDTLTQAIDEALQIYGFSDIIYEHPGRYFEWPTMQELIDTNKVRVDLADYFVDESSSDLFLWGNRD